ncbi:MULTISPECIES: hypothetical protein [unclassified Mesorhizobium]|uniref:hypothetical protein n=1 Tax=unclassified Mesorhizobium TaxID=325217 RepID=UPI0003CE7B95|nr:MULTISPECIES: hypothetical protein [unclassified Mesorhizobium]ESX29462.1 hypothetical protein X765_14220 [Mesorhizobium sp. LSHC440B00]ESX37767.1 hypothetical protein X763_12715 [Mesorhizobium sp. LSHC432A00]ESX43272.1 hypothetical protein X764_08005 [Mesorhizobium sp. LSHC440A00]ESY48076.1 hypothetical protein X746_11360 [Mesorhizobium sp. LNJC380A00]WJI57394.1 hypothetical protein NLY33_01135 [Mesorhizobium sp. C432A]
MQYTAEVLDRASGDLKLVSLGDWITVTEYGERKGVGRRKVRAVLTQVGLLREETEAPISGKSRVTRRRLTREAVEQGLGKRIYPAKEGNYPFDVLSPEGQAWIDARWDEGVAAISSAIASSPLAEEAKACWEKFRAIRRSELTSQMEVCFLLDHFPDLPQVDISRITGVSERMVSRYVTIRADQIRKWTAFKNNSLPDHLKVTSKPELIDPRPEQAFGVPPE